MIDSPSSPSIDSYFPSFNERLCSTIVIPRTLHGDAREIAKEEPLPHSVWGKLRTRGDQLVVVTNELGDVEELADFALVELHEPRRPHTKTRKDACKALLDRCHRLVEMEVIGQMHIVASAWRKTPLIGAKFSYKDV